MNKKDFKGLGTILEKGISESMKGGSMLLIKVHNDGTGNSMIGNYDVEVYINEKRIYNCRLEGHDRSSGWQDLLVKLVAKSIQEKRHGNH